MRSPRAFSQTLKPAPLTPSTVWKPVLVTVWSTSNPPSKQLSQLSEESPTDVFLQRHFPRPPNPHSAEPSNPHSANHLSNPRRRGPVFVCALPPQHQQTADLQKDPVRQGPVPRPVVGPQVQRSEGTAERNSLTGPRFSFSPAFAHSRASEAAVLTGPCFFSRSPLPAKECSRTAEGGGRTGPLRQPCARILLRKIWSKSHSADCEEEVKVR
jgi:hypothetical protein